MTPTPRDRPRLPFSRRRHPLPWEAQRSTWRDAKPGLIAAALKTAGTHPTGNWYVLGSSRALRSDAPLGCTLGDTEVIAWRGADGVLHAGPGSCPHLGAPLRESPVRCGEVVCRWHGLALNGQPFAGWEPYPAYDDGLLLWVRLDDLGGEPPRARPLLPERPRAHEGVAAVVVADGACEPEDVVANRLDPWHGAWFHPHSFVDLTVEDATDTAFTVRVSFRVTRRLVVPVRAVFTAPGPRTVVMRITDGEGMGSVVETHATPLGPDERGRPKTRVIEAVVARSQRRGFALARRAAPLLRPLMSAAAARLWRDDLAYAERRYALRATGRFPG
ncbi:DUF5914 domain-containing protein [Streptomyces oceani]|uniref:2Fe-2S ferredoxin n=1 Tax=Streptomyces oceani TaxID=1075402 RepID=A0A1E7JXT4_9ACTN|nr:DUF5914 domain-containing protein [Streptomyces oceani]OEU96487.1 2Fe-2S ferredoxin [Streptomyces oceani]